MEPWSRRRILILGMTYPSYSEKYFENACTGGIDEETLSMVRIHPVPARYLEPSQRFKKFQWITVNAARHPSDPRPESLRVEPSSIEVGDVIPAEEGEKRRQLVASSPHVVQSVEALKDLWDSDGTSLGTVRPREIGKLRIERRSPSERADWLAKEKELFAQTRLPYEQPPKPIDFPEVKFMVQWTCDDARCGGHDMSIGQWGLHELWRKLDGDPNREAKVLAKMNDELNLKQREVFLFLGNFRGKMWNFGLMDSFSPARWSQTELAL